MASRAATAALLVAVMTAALFPAGEATITCSFVYQSLLPCLGYLQSSGRTVPPGCCSGISSLVAAAKTPADRRAACGCLKTAATGASGAYIDLASSLPAKCHVPLPYKISPSVDCTKYSLSRSRALARSVTTQSDHHCYNFLFLFLISSVL
ncbi:Non-specific lipid-transfer protein [Apostasia shenzhenica]|uniref:Non-specific lipid-transfer protein n=1 Tax=Apostasia shenzhenica TaxID=1088818 RepID=A0A2I0A4U3_9ASPA|nr:Non-specific lipid-transfer protein [Apostasia shenzhenica]